MLHRDEAISPHINSGLWNNDPGYFQGDCLVGRIGLFAVAASFYYALILKEKWYQALKSPGHLEFCRSTASMRIQR
jgi:hypothetical protein